MGKHKKALRILQIVEKRERERENMFKMLMTANGKMHVVMKTCIT